jgi:hypothetical protein
MALQKAYAVNRVAIAAAGGAIAHLMFWLLAVNLDSTPWDFTCGEISCWVLFGSELPISLLYVSGSAFQMTLGSVVLGSMWWGTLAAGLTWLAKKLRRRSNNARSAI